MRPSRGTRDVTCQKVFEIDGEENKQRCSFSEQSVRHSSAPSLFTKKKSVLALEMELTQM